MRFLRRATVFALAVTAVPMYEAAAQGGAKLGYVNTQALLAQAPGRPRADSMFQREMVAYQQQVQRMRDSLQTMLESYQQAEATLTPAQRTERQTAIRTKEQEFNQRDQQAQQALADRREELIAPIMEMINKVLNDIRAEEGYALIFDVGSEANTIVAADRNLDITERAVARLKTMTPATAAQGTQPQARPAGSTPPPAGATRPRPPQR